MTIKICSDVLPKSGKEYIIISRLTNKALDDVGIPTDESVPVIQYDCHGGLNQRWHFIKGKDNVFHIISSSSGKALDIRGGSQERGAAIIQYQPHYGFNQSFSIEPVDDNYVRIRSVFSGKVLDILDGSQENGTPIIQEDYNDGLSQHWFLKECTGGQFEATGGKLGVAIAGQDGLPKTNAEYVIVSRLTKKALDDTGKATDEIIPVIQWDCHGGKNQRWRFVKGQHNIYHIISCSSGKALDIRGGSHEPGAEIIQYKPHYGPNQSFSIEPVGADYVRIRSVSSGKVLDIQGGSHDNRAPIIQEYCRDGPSQHWLLKECTEDHVQTFDRELVTISPKTDGLPKNDKEYMIVSRLSKKALDDTGKPTDEIIPVIQWDCHGGQNQRWRFVKGQNNIYHIISCSSGKALDIRGGSHESGAEIIQYKPHYGSNQSFLVEPIGDGYVRIRSVSSGKVLDIQGDSHDNRAPIIQQDFRDAHSQHWILKECTNDRLEMNQKTVLRAGDGILNLELWTASPSTNNFSSEDLVSRHNNYRYGKPNLNSFGRAFIIIFLICTIGPALAMALFFFFVASQSH